MTDGKWLGKHLQGDNTVFHLIANFKKLAYFVEPIFQEIEMSTL